MSLSLEVIEDICDVLGSKTYLYKDEVSLHTSLARVLEDEGFEYEKEVRLSARDRVDFLIEGIAVEVKIAYSRSEVLAQLSRYAQSPTVEGLVLVTTRTRHSDLPPSLNGKPLKVLYLIGGL